MSKKRGTKPKQSGIKSLLHNNGNQFMDALKLYENKSHQKSLKVLDTILKKDPQNIEALVLKGLNLNAINEAQEGESYIRNAINRIDGTNTTSICCHLLGIYMRSQKNYSESIKWFEGALSNGSTNMQIYRDLATMQSQIGDFKAALRSRKKYWESFMGYRANWTGLAVAQDVNGERQQAVNTLSQFEKLAAGKISEAEKFEHSECLLYKNDIMYRSAGDNPDKLRNVLRHLNDVENDVFDKLGLLERKAAIYMKLGEMKDASVVYRTLIKRNPDNFRYYKLLEVALGVLNDNKQKLKLYQKLAQIYPRCEPPKYVPLTFVEDEGNLSELLKNYILPQLERGVPAAFSNIKPLYKLRPEIVPKLLGSIVTEYLNSLDPNESPVAYIWSNYFMAQHHLHSKELGQAQLLIDKSIEHTPTIVEFYILKARIMKHAGMIDQAADVMNNSRLMDLQDRFINCKTVKYYLRANNIEKAVEVLSLFTKNDDGAINGVKDLHLVEASWFIVEQAEAYHRLYVLNSKKLSERRNQLSDDIDQSKELLSEIKELEWNAQKYQGLALKRFVAISKFYEQFVDDQLDFHSYCMRKGTPRAYLEMLDWGKKLYTKPMFVRALKGASNIYFDLHKGITLQRSSDVKDDGPESVSTSKKSKKENTAFHKKIEEEKKQVMAYPPNQDDDPFGLKLIETTDPLHDFEKIFFQNYDQQISDSQRDYLLDFEYHYYCGKLALCLIAMKKYARYNGDRSVTNAMAIILVLATSETSPYEAIAKMVVQKAFEEEYPELPLDQSNNATFDWINFYKEQNVASPNIKALLLLYKFNIGDKGALKESIMDELSSMEPYEQSTILEYCL